MSEYRIAICDDNHNMLDEMAQMCGDILSQKETAHEIRTFDSSEKLLDSICAGESYDLLILDIQMDGMSGMELAHRLRSINNRVSIIFVTACDGYLLEGYEVQPIYFLLKPINKQRLEAAIMLDLTLNHSPKNIAVRIGGKNISLVLSEIVYIESYNHQLAIHTTSAEQTVYSSLTAMERQLPANEFSRCHNSYLVRLEFVGEICRNEVTLRNGIRLPIGRQYFKTFQQDFIAYMNKDRK